MNSNLFRKEAFQHSRNTGSVCINTPFPFLRVTIACILLTFTFIAFTFFYEYSEQYTVRGYLNSNKGITNVYPLQAGIITKCEASQGKLVKQGDVLFVIKTRYDALTHAHKQQEFIRLKHRKLSVTQQIKRKKIYLNTLKPLLDKKYIAASVYHAVDNEISALEQNLDQIIIQLIKYKQSQSYTIRAPIDGFITDVANQVGQYVQQSHSLLSILPSNAHLIAQLYIPTSKSGYITQQDKVTLHYDAYPYQHAGITTGTIQTISQTILLANEETKPIRITEPYYKAIATLDQQTMMLYGKRHPLQLGMTCSAVIKGARKKIWQWVFDPLYTKM